MSQYYESEFESLEEAMEFCEGIAFCRGGRVVFRGQTNAEWDLKSNLFRPPCDQDEIDRRFQKTMTFVNWCQQHPKLPEYSEHEFFAIAQHYGMCTDLLDFSASLDVATFFALGTPLRPSEVSHQRAALFVIAPDDLREISKIEGSPLSEEMRRVLSRYTGVYQDSEVLGLSRLVAQEGVFVRDPGGSLEALTDPQFSLFSRAFEEEVGHPICLKKASFCPQADDPNLLAERGITHDRLFPPPNDLEREIGTFEEVFASTSYWEARDE